MSSRDVMKPLGECIEMIIDHRGKTPKKMGGDWVESGVRTISAKNIHGGKLTDIESIRCVTKEVYMNWMKEDIKRGDCLLVSEGATLGENMYWDSDEKVVLGQRVFCIRTNEERLDSKYFSAYMNTREYQREITGRSTGTSVLGMRQSELLNTMVLLKPIPEQRYIGRLYYSINSKIEVNNQINKTLEAMAQALFKQWFIDFEFPNENGEPYKSSGGEMVESELGLIPKGWEVGNLGRMARLSTRSVSPTTEPKTTFEHFSIPAFDSQKAPEFVSGETILSNKYRVEKDSILMSKLNPSTKRLWYPVAVSENAICSTEFMNYLPVSPDTREFIYCVLDSEVYTDYLVSHATGSTNSRQRVTPKSTLDYKLALPRDTEFIKRFNQNIAPLIKMGNQNIVENQTLCNVRDTLLPKLMSGEIRVPMEAPGGEA